MDILLLLARLLLAVVFVVAGLTKLIDRGRSRQALVDFGLPIILAVPFAFLLPVGELAVAATLIPTAAAWWGAMGALGLLLLFSVGIGVNLAQGHRPNCQCFGQLASSPIGWLTLTRNIALAAVAGFIVWQGQEGAGASAVAWLGGMTTVERIALLNGIVALGFAAATLWLLVQLLAQNGRLLLRLEALETPEVVEARGATDAVVAPSNVRARQPLPALGLPVGTPAPAFKLTDLDGSTQTLDALRAAGKPVLLTFTDPNCGPCDALLPDLARWQREFADRLTLVLISRGSPKVNRTKTRKQAITNVLVQEDREVVELYEAHGTPSAVLVRADGTLGSPLAQGADAIRALVERTAGMQAGKANTMPLPAPSRPRGLPPGTAAPEFELPDLNGERHAFSEWRGQRLVLIFFNPQCGFCRQMAPALAALQGGEATGRPLPLVITTGSAAENRSLVEEHGIRVLVLLQDQVDVASTYQAFGTPTGYLIDEQGAIASELTVGARALLALTSMATTADAKHSGAVPEQHARGSRAELKGAAAGPRGDMAENLTT